MVICPPSHGIPAALQQHPLYAQIAAQTGAKVQSLSYPDGPRTQVISRRIAGVPLHWLPRGPVWNGLTGSAERSRYLRTLPRKLSGFGIWIATPDSTQDTPIFRAAGYVPILTPQTVAEIDLTRPESDRLAAQHGKWRNRLRRALAAPLTYEHRPIKGRKDRPLLKHEEEQRRVRGYRALPTDFTLAWAQKAPQDTRIFIARENTAPVAYIALLLHAPVATYHLGWAGPSGRKHAAHNALLWQASNWLADQGFTRLDLGCVDTDNAPGLARFKIGSGARIRPLGPTLLRLPRIARR